MIKRLRRKFILINLLLVGLVLAVVFILFVGANVRRLAGQSDAALRLALSWQEGAVSYTHLTLPTTSRV